MGTSFTLTYKDQIEAIADLSDFEALGDEKFLHHQDAEARLEWAFYRPSGSHPDQVSDPDPMVSIMAFNHSRLGAYARFARLHPDVVADARLRIKIRNRGRMLFRAMVDDDFKELVAVLELAPVFLPQAVDQVINGRIWNETYADPQAATRFLQLAQDFLDARLTQGFKRRLQPLEPLSFEGAKTYLADLTRVGASLHPLIREHYVHAYREWLKGQSLHPLQVIALNRSIDRLRSTP